MVKITVPFSALESGINKLISKALEEEVYDAVALEEQEQIEREVYGAYEPIMYNRRIQEGGMGDTRNIMGEVKGTTLTVTNITQPSDQGSPPPTTDKDLPTVIETGVGYDYKPHPKARPFTQKTVEALQENKMHVAALKQALLGYGFKVK